MDTWVPRDDQFKRGCVQIASWSYTNFLRAHWSDDAETFLAVGIASAQQAGLKQMCSKIKRNKKKVGIMRHVPLAKLNTIWILPELSLGLVRCETGRLYQTQGSLWESHHTLHLDQCNAGNNGVTEQNVPHWQPFFWDEGWLHVFSSPLQLTCAEVTAALCLSVCW